MTNMTVKAKLILLMLVAIAALFSTGMEGWLGISNVTSSIKEIGEVRLPSILGLDMVNEGQTAIRSEKRRVAFFENDYSSQDRYRLFKSERGQSEIGSILSRSSNNSFE